MENKEGGQEGKEGKKKSLTASVHSSNEREQE